jgi:hypothetical protein
VKPKDAGDVWRLMATTDPADVRATFADREQDPQLGPAIATGRAYLQALFAEGGVGVDLAVADLADAMAEDRVRSMVRDWMRVFSAEDRNSSGSTLA